jgi:hypothetical protein
VGAVVIAVAWTLLFRKLAEHRRAMFGETLDAAEVLADRAGRLAQLFPAAFVVMGHTHAPAVVPVGGESTYVNVGSWSEPEGENGAEPHPSARAPRTHLVIQPGPKGPIGELRAWSSGAPRAFTKAEPSAS